MNILREIAERTQERIAAKKKEHPPEAVAAAAIAMGAGPPLFEMALRAPDIAFICEVKRASPSKGLLAESFPYLDIARDYASAGAAAISVLTEPYYFKGSDRYLREIAGAVSIPLLRKDFIVDSYMIYEAKTLGASAVLLICALLGRGALTEYIRLAESLGLSALVEAHDEAEAETALASGARIIGVNNRNLKNFSVDFSLSERLRRMIPPEVTFVSESGVQSPEDIERLRRIGANAVLIGETIMRSKDKRAEIARLRNRGGSVD